MIPHTKKLLIFSLIVGISIGLFAFGEQVMAIVEPHITINMDLGQTTKPFVINDNTGMEIFSVDTDGTIFPNQNSGTFVVAKTMPQLMTGTTFVLDNELKFDAEANSMYLIHLYPTVLGFNNGGLKINFDIPQGASFQGRHMDEFYPTMTLNQNSVFGYPTNDFDNTPLKMVPLIIILETQDAGTIQLKFAQDSARATASGLDRGSFLQVTKII